MQGSEKRRNKKINNKNEDKVDWEDNEEEDQEKKKDKLVEKGKVWERKLEISRKVEKESWKKRRGKGKGVENE